MKSDNQKYNNEYKKKNYKRTSLLIKPDFWLKIEEYCKYNGMSYNEFFNTAAKYALDEQIDLKGYK